MSTTITAIVVPVVLLVGVLIGLAVARLSLGPRLAKATAGLENVREQLAEAKAGLVTAHGELAEVRIEVNNAREQSAKVEGELGTAREQLGKADGRIAGYLDQLDEAQKRRNELSDVNNRLDERLREGERARAALDAERAEFDRLREENRELVSNQVLELVKEHSRQQIDEGRKILTTEAKQQLAALSEPIAVKLAEMTTSLHTLESRNVELQAGIATELKRTTEASSLVQHEAKTLAAALRRPNTSGKWGELSLKKALESLGLIEHCDFDCQVTVTSKDETTHRPDVVVQLPGERAFPIDAKAPMEAYLAIDSNTEEEDVRKAGKHHATALRGHIDELYRRAYHDRLENSADFTVLYLPLDGMLTVAVDHEPGLYQYALEKRILLATPTLLFGLLRSVELGWRQAVMAENLKQITKLGEELYGRLVTMAGRLADVGKALGGTVQKYNDLVGTVEGRVVPGARKFVDLGIGGNRPLAEITVVDRVPRQLAHPDLLAALPVASTEEPKQTGLNQPSEPVAGRESD